MKCDMQTALPISGTVYLSSLSIVPLTLETSALHARDKGWSCIVASLTDSTPDRKIQYLAPIHYKNMSPNDLAFLKLLYLKVPSSSKLLNKSA